eukprot:4318285-Pleurochrysis_carterae.AAC.2
MGTLHHPERRLPTAHGLSDAEQCRAVQSGAERCGLARAPCDRGRRGFRKARSGGGRAGGGEGT